MPSLLKHERISRFLRDLAHLGHHANGNHSVAAADAIDDLLEEIRVVRANHDQMCKDFDARNEVIEELQRDCAEAYQVIGTLGGDNLEYVEKALDNLLAATSGLPRPHNDLLPFSIPQTSADERIAQPEAELSDARANNH